MKHGLFIVMEGIDGCGKSTQVKMLSEHLQKEGKEVIVTREPGGTRIGSKIREMLLDKENKEMNYKAETFLYAADRAQHVEQKIYPALQDGKIVICDRYVDSTLAYQGGGRGIDIDFLDKINNLAISNLLPDVVFIFDVAPETGLKRNRGVELTADRLEEENIHFYRRVRDAYLDLARKNPSRYRLLDGSLSPEGVHFNVRKHLEEF